MTRILVIGGAHVDRRATLSGPTEMHASNPGTWREETGGGAFNATRALSRLGADVCLVAPRGGDIHGVAVSDAAAAAGIDDRPITFLDRATPTYTAILDEHGDLVVALADMALYDLFGPRQFDRRSMREAIVSADHVLVDANLPARTIERLAARCGEFGRPLAAIAISPAKVMRLEGVLPSLSVLFLNEREAAALADRAAARPQDWPAILRQCGLRAGIVTRGAMPAIAFDGHQAWMVEPPLRQHVVDVTGAGDALAAATLVGLIAGMALPQALRRGCAAASHVVGADTCAPSDLSLERLDALLSEVPPAVALDGAPLLRTIDHA
ncbi:carbohydrate kinase family protein [Pararhizobium haloflavum]|uniref:carbohydrate kinase family protein n=1 Tax=Pararhizobium haloflavum TaxID=2037914 RepID=UPI000C19784C|nr:carbohydrate kinase family protein [Pararhizobium haloflavum]